MFLRKTQSEYVCDTIKNTKPEVYLRKLLLHRAIVIGLQTSLFRGILIFFCANIILRFCQWLLLASSPRLQIRIYTKESRGILAEKFDDNVRRDSAVKAELLEHGIKCLIVWECTIKRMVKSSDVEKRIIQQCTGFLRAKEMLLEL